MEKYKYPDNNDNLTCLYISSKSDEEYWAKSEEYILEKIIDKIKKISEPINFLDLGCGLGRLFNVFYPYVKSITGIEPDYSRYTGAVEEAKRIDPKKIKVRNEFIDNVGEEKFNAVMISHVFQHIPFEKTKHILNMLKNVIPSGGLLFITTTFTDQSEDIFTLEYLKDKKHYAEKVNEEEFIKRFNEKGTLPVRVFSYNTLETIFLENEFEMEEMYGYHFDVSLADKMTTDFDIQRNKDKEYKGAKDVLYILRRK